MNKTFLKLLEKFFCWVAPLIVVFFCYVYKPSMHWSNWIGFGVSVIGIIIFVWWLNRIKKKLDKKVTSWRDIINKQEVGADQHISSENYTKLKRKVFIYDKILMLFPVVVVYIFSTWVESASKRVSYVMGAIMICIFIGTLCGYFAIKENGLNE